MIAGSVMAGTPPRSLISSVLRYGHEVAISFKSVFVIVSAAASSTDSEQSMMWRSDKRGLTYSSNDRGWAGTTVADRLHSARTVRSDRANRALRRDEQRVHPSASYSGTSTDIVIEWKKGESMASRISSTSHGAPATRRTSSEDKGAITE